MGYMDEIRDLIVNMAMAGADAEELERAILYSATVIREHKQWVDNYRRVCRDSYAAYHIEELENKYTPADSAYNDYDE